MLVAIESLEDRVREHSRRRIPALAARRAVIAVSGGADSIATAALLCEADLLDVAGSVVAHFDHRLRGASASVVDRDAVQDLCSRYGLRLARGQWDEPRRGEAAARDARYGFLFAAAHKHGLNVLVTGHTADDQAETVLMHAMRGAGVHGLAGIAPESTQRNCTLARPLLCISREETRAYCDALGSRFVDDPSNEDVTFLRNRIRLEMLPSLEAAQPRTRQQLLALAEASSAAASAMDALAASAIVAMTDDAIVMSRAALDGLAREVVPYAYRLAIVALMGDAREMTRAHYERLASATRTGATLELPRGVDVHIDAREVVVTKRSSWVDHVIPDDFAAALPFTGDVGGWRIEIQPASAADGIRFPAASVVRRRRAGDRVRTRAGTRKLQDVLVDLKVPRRERDALPVVAVGGEVLWTPVMSGPAPREGAAYEVRAHRLAVRS